MFPTGNLVDDLEVPGVGTLKATMINAGIPTIFVNAEAIGYTGTELQDAINGDAKALAMFETIRAHGAVRMGLIEASTRRRSASTRRRSRSSPRPPTTWRPAASACQAGDIDLLVRALSMGKLHHAMMGTAAVAIGTAAAIPGTLVNLAAGGGARTAVRFGHPSGTLRVGAEARRDGRRVDRHQGHHEPQRARADGRLGARPGISLPACGRGAQCVRLHLSRLRERRRSAGEGSHLSRLRERSPQAARAVRAPYPSPHDHPRRRCPRTRHRTDRRPGRQAHRPPRPARRLEHADQPHGHPRATGSRSPSTSSTA